MSRLIQNYGLFWRRNDVFWGRPNVRGHLKGVPAKETSADPIDFRNQAGVYVLYDENFRLVYVGQAGVANQYQYSRLKQHTKDALADRWTRFSWFGIRWARVNGELAKGAEKVPVSTDKVLDHIEAILISSSEPPHNRQGGRFGEEVTQYLQFRDPDALLPSAEEMVKEIWKKITKGNL
ncbi:MAG: GIY-YIG nuclease family protein [Terracidiphilus sp.]